MIKTFEDAVKFLEQYIPKPEKKFPGSLGFERMEYFVKLLGNPQLIYPTIHVGGTAGKGSTATIIASILSQRYKVGLYTSPHLVSICERIRVITNNSKQLTVNKYEKGNIWEREFVNSLNTVVPYIPKMEISKFGSPSYFEIVTTMALVWFAKQKVDVAVIEVGLGGQYDATNVIRPTVAVLTNIGLDHTEVLGDTVEKIVSDKVGIIKQSISVVSGAKQSSVIEIISVKCRAQSAKLSLLNRDFHYKIKEISERGSTFDYFGSKTYKNLKLRLLGEHQVENAALAIRTVKELSNYPINQLSNQPINKKFSSEEIKRGLKRAFIAGRMEIVRRKPLIMLDGAHNQDKMEALITAVKQIFPNKKAICILAIKEDKNAQAIIENLLPITKKFIVTKYKIMADQGEISSYDPSVLSQLIRRLDDDKKVIIVPDIPKAMLLALSFCKRDDFILITGSLYLIGEVKKVYEEKGSAGINASGRGHTHTV